jgi:hypothetical protein
LALLDDHGYRCFCCSIVVGVTLLDNRSHHNE